MARSARRSARLNPVPSSDLPPLPSLEAVCRSLGLTASEIEDRLRAGSRLVLIPTPGGVSVSLR